MIAQASRALFAAIVLGLFLMLAYGGFVVVDAVKAMAAMSGGG